MAAIIVLEDGTKVSIRDGEFTGSSGVIVGRHNHDPVTYAVLLDEPVTRSIERIVDVAGRKFTETEDVTFTRVEVDANALA